MYSDRLPPHNIDAEEAVLGSLLIDGSLINTVNLALSDFHSEANALVFGACQSLAGREVPIDQITVAQELDTQKKLEVVGGAAYLSHLIANCSTSLDIQHHAEIVRRLAVSRKLIEAGGKIAELGYGANPDLAESLGRADEILLEVRKHGVPSPIITPKDRAELLYERYNKLYKQEQGVAVKSGLYDLDYALGGGFYNGDMIVVGGRPQMGKTSFLQFLANYIARSEKRNVLFCSAEMNIGSVSDRDVASIVGVPINTIRRGGYADDLMTAILDAVGDISQTDVYYYRDIPMTTSKILQVAMAFQLRYGLCCLMIDYLGRLSDEYGRGDYERVTYISRKIKDMSQRLDVPVIIAHQLHREVEHRENKRPELYDLRECVTGDTLISTLYGEEKIKDICKRGNVKLYSVSVKRNKMTSTDAEAFEMGVKHCLRITTKSGRMIELSKDTPLLVDGHWVKASEIRVGNRIATCRDVVIRRHNLRKGKQGICLNTGRTHFRKGLIPWNKGQKKETNKLVNSISKKISKALKGKPMPKPEGFSEKMRRVRSPWERRYAGGGYIWLFLPDYEGSSKDKRAFGRIYEHRYVIEQNIGRLLNKEETIHHLDGVKDNNAIENLLLCANKNEHTKVHQKEQRFVERLIREGLVNYDREAEDFKFR